MKQIVVSSLAEPVGSIWRALQNNYTQIELFHIAAPLSSTPLPIYKWVIENAESFHKWDKVRFVLMDEMVERVKSAFSYVALNDVASYEGFAKKTLLQQLEDKVKINIKIIKPELSKIDTIEIPIDLLILALGLQGNYANVMPNTSIEIGWHIAQLTSEFRQIHTHQGSKSFEGAHFREYGMSLGPQQVLNAKNVIVIVSGDKKRELTEQLFSYDSFHPEFPLSIIYHPIVADKVEVFLTEDVLK